MLTKPPATNIVMGQPYIPPRAAREVCPPAPPEPPPHRPGQWVTECTTTTVLVGWDNGPASPGNPGPFPKPIYITGGVTCRRVWRPD